MSNALEIPQPQSWRERSKTVGMLKGGIAAQVHILGQLLAQLPRDKDATIEVETQMGGSETLHVHESCNKQLSPMGLVARGPAGSWTASEYARYWLANPSDLQYLTGVIHAHCRFFGEVLAVVDDATTHEDLLSVARNSYNLSWEKLDPVRRRVGWLRSLGMVELWGHKLVVTESGRTLLERLELTPPSATEPDDDGPSSTQQIKSASPSIALRAGHLSQKGLVDRREPIGYIPRGTKRNGQSGYSDTLTATEGLRKAVGILGDGITIDEFKLRAKLDLGVHAGSFTAMLHALRHMEFVELVAYNKYGPTEYAYACLEPGKEADLVRFFHAKFSFFGELLTSCPDWMTTSKLLARARSAYGFNGDADDIRTRIALLVDVGMLLRFDKTRVRISPAGRDMLAELVLQEPASTNSTDQLGDSELVAVEELSEGNESRVDDLIDRLRSYSANGGRSSDLEVAIGEAIEFLGFKATRIGGSGDTDVLAEAELTPDQRFKVIFEAKATSSSTVPESQVNFEGIKRHWRKNEADHAAIVGLAFPRSVVDSAAANNIAVITTEDLASLLLRHQKTPISLAQLRLSFSPSARNLEEVDPHYEALDRTLTLAGAIVLVLQNEALEDDPEAQGYVNIENFRWALRTVDLSFRPSKEEINSAIELLSHPIIRAVASNASGELYALADSPKNISRRIVALGDRISSQVVNDEP